MNLKRSIVSLITITLLVTMVTLQGAVYATVAEPGKVRYMGVTELMNRDDEQIGYSISNPNEEGSAKIWNIVEYTEESGNNLVSSQPNMYCVKAGVGFTEVENAQLKRQKYDVFYDMKTERKNINEQNEVLKALTEKTIDGTGVSCYNAILAAMDMFYLPGQSPEQDKKALIEKIINCVKTDDEYSEYRDHVELMEQHPLTTNDIVAVQQAALWYFTNYGEGEGKYNKTGNSSWLWYTTDGRSYDNLTNYESGDEIGKARSYQAEALYHYIIENAKANANNYADSSSEVGTPVTTTITKKYEINGDNYIVGPIRMTENASSNKLYTIDFKVENNGTQVSDYKKLVVKNGSKEETTQDIKDLVGQDFYISIPKGETTSVKITVKVNYSNTSMTLWASTENNQAQPLVEVKKDTTSTTVEETITPTPEREKNFDLALRKYITKINGKAVTNTRVPNIDESALTSGTTASYKHRKEPLQVAKEDQVTYQLTIYNEGDQAGRASKIIDQLPTGLEFTKVVSDNYTASYDKTNNTVTLTKNNETNLPAYETGNLVNNGKGSETIELECKVTATPDQKNGKILTNVAWISEAIDENGTIITSQQGLDRDSEPATKPNAAKDNMEKYKGYSENKNDLTDPTYYYKGEQDDDDFEKLVLLPQAFDLKLIKRITAINDQNVPERIEDINVTNLNKLDENGNMITSDGSGKELTTAVYDLNKDPIAVKKGDIVTYTFRIYNEGTIDGYAEQITEDIPEGLEFLWSDKEGDELQADDTLTEEEKAAIQFNQDRYWTYKDQSLNTIQTDYLARKREPVEGDGTNLIKAFGINDGTKTKNDLSYKEIAVKFKVISDNVAGTIIRNEAAITEDLDKEGNEVEDRDSQTDQWVKYQDDEDYDNIILQSFDLALRKFIAAVSKDTNIENSEYLKNADGSYTRAPSVDTSKLNAQGEDGKIITTAVYNHTKEPVKVQKNDYVVYFIRVYNEGDLDGYAAEVKDHLPPYLEFVEGDFNKEYNWTVSEDGRTVTTTYLATKLLEKAKLNGEATQDSEKYILDYEDIPIMCQVKDTAKTGENITNIADITKYEDEKHEAIEDRDSQANNVELPQDENLPSYKDSETGSYVPGQQDDDDFEKVLIQKFDLALRKFITKVDDKDIDTRIPQVKYADGKISYEHTKVPVDVITDNIVTYTIRIYNEGELDGYAKEVTDDLPEGLEFLPEHETNKTYGWVMYDEEGNETDKVEEAVKVTTDYLSKEKEAEDGEGNLLKAFDPNAEITDITPANPDYRDVQIAFKVIEPNGSSKILVNTAQISEDADKDGNPIDDDDSIPNEWNDGEDDQDNEYVKLSNFDLALRKWVTQAIVIENGKQTVTNTGHQPYDDPEQIVKVELNRKKLNSVTVKFRYSIRVINEGDIAGYAKEVTDYVPQGLKFVAEDNPGWKDEGNNVISTRALENTLLQPGEYADVEVVLTWINNENNMGVMENTAEISEDYNEQGIPDKDSTPDNKKKGEDDIDDAPVMLSIGTGKIATYFTLGFIILITIAGGVALIKKFVL